MVTAGRRRGRGAEADEELVAQRLQQASDAQLQQLARYQRPKLQTLTLCALAVEEDDEIEDDEGDDDSESESDGGEEEETGKAEEEEEEKEKEEKETAIKNDEAKEETEAAEREDAKQRKRREPVVVTQQPLEMLEGASLADVRKLIMTFCATKIPPRFVFAVPHRRRQQGLLDEDTDERKLVVEDALDADGVLVVLIPSMSSRMFTHGTTFSPTHVSPSRGASTSPRSQAAANVLPAFSAPLIVFGDVAAAVNVFIRRSDGVTLELSGFCDRGGAKIGGLSTAELTMHLIPKVLAQRVGMTESMVSILLSSPRGQTKVIKKLLGKLHLTVVEAAESSGEKELRWQWTGHNIVADKDLHVNRRIRVVPQVDEAATGSTEVQQDENEETQPSALLSTESQEDAQLPDIGPTDDEEQPVHADFMSLASIGDVATLPVPEPGAKPLVKKSSEVKAQPCEEVRSKPIGTPPEKKKPDQSQATKPLVRKSSVDVNAVQLRSCLEIGAMQIGDDIPSCFSLQMIFIELMLRDFASSSLPVFVSEVRPALKEVYRSASQTSTPEIVVKSIDLLWAGLSVAFWESKLDQIVAHFHKVTTAAVSDLRSKLAKSNFEVLEASPLTSLPGHVDAMLRALAVLAGEQQVGEKSIETIVKDLGLNNATSKRRLKCFKALLKKKSGVHALTPSSMSLLATYVAAADLTRSRAPEDQCQLSSLRSLLTAVLDTIDFDLRTYARRYVAAGENATNLRSGIWSLITRKERSANIFVSESTKNVESLTAAISTWASERVLAPDQMKRLAYLLQQQSADPVRWYKAQRDCEALAHCPVPSRLRWYIEPKSSWCELRNERYMLVGEADFVFEFVYLHHQSPPPPDQSTLVKRALSAWFDVGATIEGGNALGPSDGRDCDHVKVAFGVNYRYAGHPAMVTESLPDLKRILGYSHIDSVVIGCSHGAPGCANVVKLRFYAQESFAQQQSWSASVFLRRVLEEGDIQKKMIEHGLLPLLRMLALREQRKREPVVSLDEVVSLGDSQAHMAFRAALKVSGCIEPLVLSPSVAHWALDLIVRRRVNVEYGCEYLRSLHTFVEEASIDSLCEFMNQRFERFEDPRALDPEADVCDILWFLASRESGFANEWREVAEQIVTRVFLLPGVLDDRRIFQYSSQVGDDLLHLRRHGNDNLGVIEFDTSNEDVLAYFERIPWVVQTTRQGSKTMVTASPRFSVTVDRTPFERTAEIVEDLLERFFAVLRTEAGLLSLFKREEVVTLLDDMLEERGHSSKMALLAVELVAYVADVCGQNEEVQQLVCGLRLVDHLVGVLWRVESEVVGRKLINALSNFQSLPRFREQVVLSLPRLSGRPASYREHSLLGEIFQSAGDVGERDEYGRRVRRFNSHARSQFLAVHGCSCGGQKIKRHTISIEAERELVKHTATGFASAVIRRATTLVVAGRAHEQRVSASQRLLSAAIRFRKAAKIQHKVLRWLYVSKRLLTRPHPITRSLRSCGVCERGSSFVEGVVRFLDAVEMAEPIQTTHIQDATTKALQCFQIFVSDHGLCQVLVSEFRLHRTLLVLISSKSQAIRSLALKVLAELCWRSPIAFDFTRSRLMKPIWENFAALMKKNENRYCSWIERTLNVAANKSRVASSQPTLPTVKSRDDHRDIKDIGNSDPDPDLGPAASMVMVLSYGAEDFDLMLRVVRLTSGSVNQWVHESAPHTHVKMLLVIQNTLILAPSLSSLRDVALKCVQDFRLMLNAVYVNDHIAKALIYGIMWTMCTNVQIRKEVANLYPDVFGDVLKWMEATTSGSQVPHLSILPMLLNGAGLAATVSVDVAVKPLSPQIIRSLNRLYSNLEALEAERNLVRADTKSTRADEADPTSRFCSAQSQWAIQLARFRLLPEIGSFRCLSTWEQVANGVKDQVFRLFAIVASSQSYDDDTSAAALECYVHTLESQVRRGGSSADFALKTLPHVFRCATTAVIIDSVTKKPAITEEQASRIVDVLGATIQMNADLRKGGSSSSNNVSTTKTIRLVVMALWGLQVASGKAQSLSHALANELVELLRVSKDDTKLRIAILGLLVKMYRVRTHSESETQAATSSVSDRNQVRVLRVVMSEVPTIMELLRPLSSSEDGSKIVHHTKLWSPLLLDKSSSTSTATAQHEHKLGVVKSVRWPIEVLNLLCESIFIEKIALTQDYYDVLLSILLPLDTKSMRSSDIQGRDEVLLAIARILSVFCQRLPLTPAQADRCIHALFESDSMMTYASDLATICHRTVELSRSIDALIRRPERKILVASLCFINSGKLRLDVLSKCLEMVSAFVKAMGEEPCMSQLMLYERDHGSASAALFRHVVKIFQGVIKEEIEWAVCRKGLKLLQELITWDSFLNRVVRSKAADEDSHSKKVKASFLESVSQRSRTHMLDETTRGMVRMALLLVHFKHWLGDVASSFYNEVLQASAHASQIIVRMLQDFHENSNDSVVFLAQVADAFIHNNQHKLLPSSTIKDSMEALVYVFCTTFKDAKNSLRSSFLSREACEAIYISALDGLVSISMHHRACHSVQMTRFFIQNYRSPIFEEPRPEVLAKLLRLYRRCCCNAFVYRLIRLGETSMWSLIGDEDDDQSFYRRLGASFAEFGSSTGSVRRHNSDGLYDHACDAIRFDIALFLGHQHFSISSLPSSTENAADVSPSEDPETLIKPADEKVLRMCLRDEFTAPTTSSTISYSATEFEAGVLGVESTDGVISGSVVVNQLVEVIQCYFGRRNESAQMSIRSIAGDEETLVLLAIVDQLASVAGATPSGVVFNRDSWCSLLRVVKTCVLHVSELHSLLKLLRHHVNRVESTSTTAEIADALSTRIGLAGIRSFGLAPCLLAMEFTNSWVVTMGDGEISQLLKTPRYLDGIFDVLLLSVLATEEYGMRFCQDAFGTLLTVAEIASDTNVQVLVRMMDDWKAVYPSSVSTSSCKAACDTIWQVLLALVFQRSEIDFFDWKQDVFRLIRRLVQADSSIVVERLHTHNFLPFLCQQVFEHDRAVAKSALDLLHGVCGASPFARRSLCSLVCVGVIRPYQDGILMHLRAISWNQSAELSPDAYRAQRDQGKIVDLLARQAICASLSPDEILELSLMLNSVRFAAGESINLSVSSPPTLLIVASGSVEWTFTVRRVSSTSTKLVYEDTSRISKGGVIGVRGLLMVRHSERFEVSETATAANDVVCLVASDQVWQRSPLSDKIRVGLARATGAWHRWLKKEDSGDYSSACYARQLVDLASGEMGLDPDIQDLAADLLHHICSSVASSQPENGDVDLRNSWFLSLVMPIIQRKEAPAALRRDICRLMADHAVHSRWGHTLASLSRESSRRDGLVVLGRAFRLCATDPVVIGYWFRVVVLLSSRETAEAIAASDQSSKVLIRAMTDGDLLRLVAMCLATPTNGNVNDDHASLDPWVVFGLACRFQRRLRRLVKALDSFERLKLTRRLVLMLTQDFDAVSLSLWVLAKATMSSEFCIALWSMDEVPDEDGDTIPDFLFLLKRSFTDALCPAPAIDHIVEIIRNSLKAASVPDDGKRQIIGWLHQVLGTDPSPLHHLQAQPSTLSVSEQSNLTNRVCSLVRVIDWCCAHLKTSGTRVMARELRQTFSELEWLAVIESHFVTIAQAESASRTQLATVLATMRILYDSPTLRRRDDLDRVGQVLTLLQNGGNHAQSNFIPRSQRDPVLLSMCRGVIPPAVERAAELTQMPREISSPHHFVETNCEGLTLLRQNRSAQAELVRRLQLLREICAHYNTVEAGTLCGNGEGSDNCADELLVNWLVGLIGDSSARVVRVTIGCLLNLLGTRESVQQYVSVNAEERILPHCFAAFAESPHARVSKIQLLKRICSLMDRSADTDATDRRRASEWMRTVMSVLLQHQFDVKMIQSLVKILRWLLSRFKEACFASSENSSGAEELIKYVQTSLIAVPPHQKEDPTAAISAALDGFSIVVQILALENVRVEELGVVSSFANTAVSWTAFVSQSAESESPTSTAHDTLFFGCLAAICQLDVDKRYDFQLKNFPRTQTESLLKSCFRVISVLPKFRSEYRKTLLQTMCIVLQALQGEHRQAAQAELASMSSHDSGWMTSLASDDLEERSRASVVLELMCERNHRITAIYATAQSPILLQLVANLRRCNEVLHQPSERSTSVYISSVLELCAHTSTLLRRFVRALALVHQSIDSPLLEEVEVSLLKLQEGATVSRGGECETRAYADAMKASIWLLKSSIKHHVGFCRRQLSRRWLSVLLSLSRALLTLHDQDLDQCADALVGVVNLAQFALRAGAAASARQDVDDLLFHLLERIKCCDGGENRNLSRLFRAVHALMASSHDIVGKPAKNGLSARGLPTSTAHTLVNIYPRFILRVETQVVVDFCALALDLDDTLEQRLEASIVHSVESAHRGFLNSSGVRGKTADDAAVRGRQVQTLSSFTKVLCTSLSLWELLIARAQSPDLFGEGRVGGKILWSSVLAGLVACSEAKLTVLVGRIASEAASLMRDSCSTVSAFPGHVDVDDSVARLSELLQAHPMWQLAWLLTSFTRRMRSDRSSVSLPARLQHALPLVISTTKLAVNQNHVHSSFQMLGLIVEALRELAQDDEVACFPAWGPPLFDLLQKALQLRSSVEFTTLALLCWFLLARLEMSDRKARSLTTIASAASGDVEGCSLDAAPHDLELFVRRAASLVSYQVAQLDREPPTDSVFLTTTLKNIPSMNRHGADLKQTVDTPAITLLDQSSGVRRVVCVYITLKILQDAILDESSRDTIGRLFAEQTSVISDVSHLLDKAESLPAVYAEVVLHLVAGATKTFRLFSTPVVNEVRISSVSRLILFPDVAISVGAMNTLWQLLRNRRLCHRVVALVKSAATSTVAGTDDPAVLQRAIQHVKELVYTVELDARRLVAAYGILVQISKAEESLDLVVVMDELHAQAIFMEDPHNLLAAMGPSAHPEVLLQQCKLLKHLSRWRPHSVLAKPAALQCLGDAIVAVAVDSSLSKAPWLLAVGSALVSLVELVGSTSTANVQNLRLLLEDRQLAVVHGCHQALSWAVHSLSRLDEPLGREYVRLQRVFAMYASLFFSLTSSKRKLCLFSGIVSDVTELPRTILQALDANRVAQEPITRGPAVDRRTSAHGNNDQVHLQLLRTLRRLTLAASIAAQFRSHDAVLASEPFDLLMSLLNQEHLPNRDSYVRELFLVILHVSRDNIVSTNIATRHDVLTDLFQFHTRHASVAILDLFWQVLHNVVSHVAQVGDILQRVSSSDHVTLLAQHVPWGTEQAHLSLLALAMTSALRVIAEKSSVHRLMLLFVPVFHRLSFESPWNAASSAESLILENIMVTLALTAHACANDFEAFENVLSLMEKLVALCTVDFGGARSDGSPVMRNGSATQPLGLPTAVERVLCALCDLLLSFHEDEVNNSFFPGYEIKPVRNASHGPTSPTPSNTSHDRKRSARAPEVRANAVASLCVRSKSNGVFSKGYSPTDSDVVERILRIFTSACTLPVARARVERLQLRSGRSIGGASAGSSILYVSDFFFHAAKTPSGRFFFLNPLVIQFWTRLLPRMDPFSLRKLCDGLVVCTFSKDHVFKFLASGALRLLVTATCTIIRSSSAKKPRGTDRGAATKPLPVVAEAFLQLVVAAAVLTERAPFLQSTYYLVYAGASESISIAGFVLAAIIYSSAQPSFLKLACKVLSRLLSLFTLEEAAEFLASCPAQMARALGWDFVTDDDVVTALVTMLLQTEDEALMKHRVLVEVVHSTLLRTAILGLIDKGIPEVLHDYGLKTMMLHMEKLVSACNGLLSTSNEAAALPSNSATSVEPMSVPSDAAPRRRNSITGGAKTSVEKLAAGFTAVGGVARNAGTLLATTFQDEDNPVEPTDPRSRFSRRLQFCVDALRDVTNEIAEYTETGYTKVFKSFELMNGDLELIAAMQSSSHAVALTQAAFYAMEILQEALTAALLEADEAEDAAEGAGGKTSESKAPMGADKIPLKVSSGSSTGSGGRSSLPVDATLVLQKAEELLGLITISLQHSDMDVLFYGSKLIQLGSYADALIRLPLDDHDDEHEHDTGHHERVSPLHTEPATDVSDQPPHRSDSRRLRHQQPALVPRRRIQRTENYPVFLRFRSLELRSWLWSVVGFLPYLRVRHNGNVQIIRFNKATAAVEGTDEPSQRLRDAFREYLCRFEVRDAHADHIQTFFRDLPHTVDVEVWIYLPFWPRDVLVSRAKVPLLARTIENDGYNFHLYPESARGVRANQAEIIGTLQMDVSNQRSEATEASFRDVDNEFPAYSTLGSRVVRRILRRVWSRIFAWTSDAVSTVAEVTQVNRLVEAATNANMRRKGLSVLATQDLNDSLDRQDDSVTMEESVAYFLTKILRLLRELTHPDKLVAPGAVKDSKPLVDELEAMLPAFAQTLARAFKTKNTRVWRDTAHAADVVQGLFLTKGLAFFTTSFQHQGKGTDNALFRGSKPSATRKLSQNEPRTSLFSAATTTEPRLQKKPLRDIASQLRRTHLHEDKCIRRLDDEHDVQRNTSQSTFGSRLLGRSMARASPSAKLLSSMKSRHSQFSDGRLEREAPTLSTATEYIHQYTASKSELRMLSSHISIWSLSQARVPEWHSFNRAVGQTALNHFLLQPIERLQVYCAVQRFLQQKLKLLQQSQDPSTAQPPTAALAPSAELTRIRSASSIVSKFHSSTPSTANAQRDIEMTTPVKESHQPHATTLSMATKEAVERGPSFSNAAAETKGAVVFGVLWKKTLDLTGQANRLQKALNRAPDVTDFEFLETIRARRLLKYHLMDPFDAASRLQRLYQDAKRLPSVLYREGIVASIVHFAMWALLTVTVWRVSIARDAMRDSERSFQELHSSQSSGDNDQIHEVLVRRAAAKTGSVDASTRDHTPRIVISNREESQDHFASSVKRIRRHQVAPGGPVAPDVKPVNATEKDCIVLTQQELKHLVVLLELRSLVSDVFRVWPSENGNIGLNGFWSSLWFTATALGSPFLFVYVIFPWLIGLNDNYTRYLSYVACAYGTAWILAAYVSIRGVTKKIPAFREVRRVEKINLTSLPYCVRNYMAIGSVVWEGFQLNTTSFSVWKMSYKPKQLAALTTIDLQDIGLGSLQVNVFESKQTLALVSLLVWFFCLKASNKFKSLQYLNYSLTFLLPNFLGGMLFMFLSKQFYQTAACFENAQNVTVMWANSDIACWTDPAHTTYALRGMFGMSIFVPLAVLAYGSYQVFFPEVNLDVQTSPLLNVSSQIVKAAMMGALTFFVDKVQLFLAVALVGNLLLLFLVTKYDLCSTWHLKYGKVLIYAMSSWAAFCAMVSTFVREGEDKDRVPLYIMHIGWATLTLLGVLLARRRMRKNQREAASGRQVLIKQQKPKTASWRRKAPSSVTPEGSRRETATGAAQHKSVDTPSDNRL